MRFQWVSACVCVCKCDDLLQNLFGELICCHRYRPLFIRTGFDSKQSLIVCDQFVYLLAGFVCVYTMHVCASVWVSELACLYTWISLYIWMCLCLCARVWVHFFSFLLLSHQWTTTKIKFNFMIVAFSCLRSVVFVVI